MVEKCSLAAIFNLLGAMIRIGGLYVPEVIKGGDHKLPAYSVRGLVSLFGGAVCGCAYPFIMFLPAKVRFDVYLILFALIHNVQVGSAWFNEKQRAIATMIIALSNPLGVLMPSFISPRLVR